MARRLGKTVDDIKAMWAKNSQEASKSACLACSRSGVQPDWVTMHVDRGDMVRRNVCVALLRLGSFMHLTIVAFLNGAHITRPLPELDMFLKFIKTLHGLSLIHI